MWSTSLAFLVVLSASIAPSAGEGFDPTVCNRNALFLAKYRPQIQDLKFQRDLIRVRDQILQNERGSTYEATASFVDTFGPRFTSGQPLQNAIIYLAQSLVTDFPDNVQLDPLVVPNWSRGRETAMVIDPVLSPLQILGYLGAVGTDGQNVVATILLVRSARELRERRYHVSGRFVVLDFPFECTRDPVTDSFGGYGPAFRNAKEQVQQALALSCRFGAKALFVRSATAESLNTPHTDYVPNNDPNCRIPIVALTIEDTEMLARMVRRSQVPTIRLNSGSKLAKKPEISKNIVGKFPGSAANDPEAILVTGQSDSVDVGQGAVDNAAGTFLFTQGLQTIASMVKDGQIPPPLKTIKFLITTGTELGSLGTIDYVHRHGSQFGRIALALESDKGVFWPQGMTIGSNTNGNTLLCIIHDILDSMRMNVTQLEVDDDAVYAQGADMLQACGLPVSTPLANNKHYLAYQDSAADRMSVLRSEDLDRSRAMVTCLFYGLARLQGPLVFGERTSTKKCPVPLYVRPPTDQLPIIERPLVPTPDVPLPIANQAPVAIQSYGNPITFINAKPFNYYRDTKNGTTTSKKATTTKSVATKSKKV